MVDAHVVLVIDWPMHSLLDHSFDSADDDGSGWEERRNGYLDIDGSGECVRGQWPQRDLVPLMADIFFGDRWSGWIERASNV